MIDTLIAAIVGVVVGWLLNEISTRGREKRNDERQVRSIRTILRLEMESNLYMLTQFWSLVKHLENPSSDETEQSIQFAHQFIELSFPPFREEGVKSQLSMLPLVLKNDEEVNRVIRLYERIDKLGAIRIQLADLDRTERELRSPSDIRAYIGPHPFRNRAPDLWGECEQLVTKLLQEGNPL